MWENKGQESACCVDHEIRFRWRWLGLTWAEHFAAALANVCTGATSLCLMLPGLMTATNKTLEGDDGEAKMGGTWQTCLKKRCGGVAHSKPSIGSGIG